MTKSTIKGRCPLINPQKRKAWRQKRKIKNNPEEKPPCRHPWIFLLPFVRHPWMPLLSRCPSPLNGSTRGPQYLKASGFPPPRHPGNLQAVFSLPLNASIRGPWFLKVFGFPIKDFGNDGWCGCLNGSTRALNNGRGHALSFPMEGQKKAKTWMPA